MRTTHLICLFHTDSDMQKVLNKYSPSSPRDERRGVLMNAKHDPTVAMAARQFCGGGLAWT